MRSIPRREDVPLKYIIRENDLPDLTPNKDFLGGYVNNVIEYRMVYGTRVLYD